MENLYKNYLLTKSILVKDNDIEETDENKALILTRLYNDYGVVISDGDTLVDRYTYAILEEVIGWKNVPEAFYRNFPHDVKKLSHEQLLVDQIMHYFTTYGLGNFNEAGRSIFEDDTIRPMLIEKGEIKRFKIVDEVTAMKLIKESCVAILAGTRPLNNIMYELIKTVYYNEMFTFNDIFGSIASKNTTMRLLNDFNDDRFAKFLSISDIPKFVEIIADELKQPMNKLNLPNTKRKTITKVIDKLFSNEQNVKNSICACCEKKKLWCGILHQIHYKPKNSSAKEFVDI